MSIDKKFINWRMAVRESTQLTSTEKLVCFVLNTYMNDNHDFAYPSVSTISGQSGLAQSTVRKTISQLTEKGWLICEPQFDYKGGQTSNKYYIDIPLHEIETLREIDTPHRQKDTPPPIDRGHPSIRNIPPLYQIDTNSTGNSSLNSQGNSSLNSNRSSVDDRFEEWWTQYPKKVGKKNCHAIWKRRKLNTLADTLIHDTMKRNAEDRKWKDGFIPNPQTYLNGDRWEDEIDRSEAVGKPGIRNRDGLTADELLEKIRREHSAAQ